MTNEEAEAMRLKLCEYYGDQVLPVRDVCEALFTWANAAGPYLKNTYGIDVDMERLHLATSKSALLARLLYGRQKLRTTPCPECKGEWRGLFLECPCGGCGWMPEP